MQSEPIIIGYRQVAIGYFHSYKPKFLNFEQSPEVSQSDQHHSKPPSPSYPDAHLRNLVGWWFKPFAHEEILVEGGLLAPLLLGLLRRLLPGFFILSFLKTILLFFFFVRRAEYS